MPRGLDAVDGGGYWLKRGGEGNVGWCVNGEGGDNGAVPMQGGWIGQELRGVGGHGKEMCCRLMSDRVQVAAEVVSRRSNGRG